MPLDEYRRKRDFTKSPEPTGTPSAKTKTKAAAPLFFCVQKHLASHLHYDLRLEWNGVLLSWAVPKGPSIDPRDKRLAMHVEDHPIEYGNFEGVIPEGYGAGIVLLWDQGTWEAETDDPDAALRKGELKFRLTGYKLKGSWVLIRTRGFPGAGEGKSWLLIKHRDDWSGPINITEFAPLSVKTPNADFAEILSGKTPDIWRSNAPAKGGDTGKMFQTIIQRASAFTAQKAAVPARPRRSSPVKAPSGGGMEMTAPKTTNAKGTKTTKKSAKAAKKPR